MRCEVGGLRCEVFLAAVLVFAPLSRVLGSMGTEKVTATGMCSHRIASRLRISQVALPFERRFEG